MSFSDVLRTLHADGLKVSHTQLRWAIDTAKVSRPPMDGSHRFIFGSDDVAALRQHFQGSQKCELVA